MAARLLSMWMALTFLNGIKVGVDTTGTGIFDLGPFDANYNYQKSEVCETTDHGFFISLMNDNLGNTPVDSPDEWEAWGGRSLGVGVWWGEGQTERLPNAALRDGIIGIGVGGAQRSIKGFTGGAADEAIYGTVNLTWTNSNAESDIDFFASSDAENSVFEFADAGRYNITLHFYGNQDTDAGIALILVRIQSGTDDVATIDIPGYSASVGDPGHGDIEIVYHSEVKYFDVASGDKYYVQLEDVPANEFGLSGYMLIERAS